MKVLFLDDSYVVTKDKRRYLGYGGFCIDAADIRSVADEVSALKKKEKIPELIELKWSPGKNHYLRTSYKRNRQSLYQKAIRILADHDAEIIVAVHDLNQCYGISRYGWDIQQAKLWATKQQFHYISERFERPLLSSSGETGLVIADQYESKSGEIDIIEDVSLAYSYGTEFQKFERVSMIPLMTISKYCPHIQLADIVVGITVSSVAGGRYGLALLEDVAKLFFLNPHEKAHSYSSIFSSSALGYGLIMFPSDFRRSRGRELLKKVDDKYIWSDGELKDRKT